jgi:hypothetical protein
VPKKTPPDPKVQLPILYQQMAELTLPECRDSCRSPHSCCAPEYCDFAAITAKEDWNTELTPTGHPRLPFMGESGCTVPPHMRPMCTMHTCAINSLGFKPGDMEWTKKYFTLREKIETLELSLPKQRD